jgi:hypothetical protein
MFYQGNTNVVSRYLEPDEELLWAGQPPRGFVYRTSDIIIAPIGMVLFLYALSLEAKGLSMANGPVGLLYALPLTLFALYLAFGRFLLDLRIRNKTFYAITDKRVFIVSGFNGDKVRSLNVDQWRISIDDGGNGWGTVIFDSDRGSSWLNLLFPGMATQIALEEVPRLQDVTKSIKQAQTGAIAAA